MRPFQALCKLLQRQTYSCLSTRSGIWFCLGGLILITISALQFGELLLEWSMQKYNLHFNSDHDNVAGKSFQQRLCLPGPVDVVYTWVNGSDPQLIEELTVVKRALMFQLNITKKARNDSLKAKLDKNTKKAKSANKRPNNSEEKFLWNKESACPYPNCVPFHAIAVAGLNKNLSEFALSYENKFLPGFEFSSFENSIDPSVRVLVFSKDFDFNKVKNHSITVKGKGKEFTRVFVSSTVRMGAKKLDGFGIINSVPTDVTAEMIRSALHQEKVVDVSVHIANNVSVITPDKSVKEANFVGSLRGKITIKGQRFKIQPATFIWKPLTSLEIGRDIIEEDVSTSRFADNEELKYSLRSIQKYAPWVRNIYIVTNGQIPSWLNLDHPRMKIVTHKQLFTNKSHLPTFSSPAIETHIHRIPGLSKRFIYMNDDVFFGDNVWPDDFYTHAKGQKVYLTWPVPNCNEGCPASWVNDKYCDKPCNVSECDWDGGDCINTKGKPGFPSSSLSHMIGNAYSAIGEYCNGGCANSWIGDCYCDGNCNVPNCGYDAGDCGIDKFHELFSIDAAKIKQIIRIPTGIRSFFINFTSLLNDGVLSDGNYAKASVVRAVVFSKKFKTMAVTLYVNFTTQVPFAVTGFCDKNETIPISLNFTISVDTSKDALTTTKKTATKILPGSKYQSKSKQPYTVYNEAMKQEKQLPSDQKMAYSNKTMNEVFVWYKETQREIPVQVLAELNKTEVELRDGDITETGYRRKKFRLIHPFFESSQLEFTENTATQGQHQRAKRHLLSQSDSEEAKDSSNTFEKPKPHAEKSFIQVKIVDGPHDEKSESRRFKEMRKRTSLSRWVSKYGHWDPINDIFSTSPHRWERQHFFAEILSATKRFRRQEEYTRWQKPSRALLDTFASSLLHVSRLYNRAFGYKARKVPAHMPHFVDVDVINQMQSRFRPYFDETSSHKIRSENDMQFAFSYSYYVMDVPAVINMSSVFDELDTDATGTLSDRELRTLAARMYSLPLQPGDVQNMESILQNCSREAILRSRSGDSIASTVTRELVVNCAPIESTLKESIKRKQYNFELIGDEDITFKMIRNNVSHLIYQLDWIRKNRRKFVCLNDNIDHENPQSKLIRTILKDFLEYLFPEPSQFELPQGYRNQFLKISDLEKWKEKVRKDEEHRRMVFYLILIIVLGFLMRRLVFRLYRTFVNLLNKIFNSKRGLSFNETELVKI